VFVRADLDGFKDAQDCVGRGHEWGDACLRDFVNYVGSNVRQLRTEVSDEADMLFGREGGDEFLIVATSYEGAGRIAQAIGAWTHEGVTASVGIGVTVQAADAALYAAKRARRRSRSLPRRLRIGLGLLKSLPRNLLGRLVA
jgi:GGDEF domain-containing protein